MNMTHILELVDAPNHIAHTNVGTFEAPGLRTLPGMALEHPLLARVQACTDMSTWKSRSQGPQHEIRDGVSGDGQFTHKDAPFGRVALLSPVSVGIRVVRVKNGPFQWNHLKQR